MKIVTTIEWKNKNGTKDRKCSCGSWLNHWASFSGIPMYEKCRVDGCEEDIYDFPFDFDDDDILDECDDDVDDGAHVINPSVAGEWIVPLCHKHNMQKTGSFNLKDGTILVSANKSKTCDSENPDADIVAVAKDPPVTKYFNY